MQMRLPHAFDRFLSDGNWHHTVQSKEGATTLSYLEGVLLHRSNYGRAGNFLLFLRFKSIMKLHRIKRRILRAKEKLELAIKGENEDC